MKVVHLFGVLIIYSICATVRLGRQLRSQNDPQTAENGEKMNRIFYTGEFGLGHSLSKLSAAYDRACAWKVPLQVHWGCKSFWLWPKGYRKIYGNRIVRMRNDVYGYHAGQDLKNSLTPVQPSQWQTKLKNDVDLFTQIRRLFAFSAPKSWASHFVYGIHLRHGNGEQDHFVASGRDKDALSLDIVAQLIEAHLRKNPATKPPMLFVATDTPSLVTPLHRMLKELVKKDIPLVRWTSSESCLDDLRDMMLLSHVDTLIATSRSTFTQILPRALLEGEFCEADEHGMDCTRDQESWLFRKENVTRYRLKNDIGNGTSDIIHKVMVHLPVSPSNHRDIEARQFLDRSSPTGQIFRYGQRFNKEYRQPLRYTIKWTFASPNFAQTTLRQS